MYLCFLNLFHYNLYTSSCTYCAHCAGVLDLSNVCHGIGFPIAMRNDLCTFLYISSTRKSIAMLNFMPNALQMLARV